MFFIILFKMISQAIELPTINQDASQALPRINKLLSQLGLQVLPSFDLRAARLAQPRCACPYHGTSDCDCQMVVLLLYGHSDEPTTLLVHGHQGKTFLSLVDAPGQRPEEGLPDQIRQALLANATYS
jgi:hypothetical protein